MHFVRMYNAAGYGELLFFFYFFFCLQIKASAGFGKACLQYFNCFFLYIYIFLQLGYIILYLFSL